MFSSLASLSVRHPRRLALVALVLFIVAGVLGGPTAGLLKARNSFQDPGSQSARAQRALERATGAEPSAGVLALFISLRQYQLVVRYLWSSAFRPLAGIESKTMAPIIAQTPLMAVVIAIILIGLFAFASVLLRMV